MLEDVAKILELFSNKRLPFACVAAGFIFAFYGVCDVTNFKSLPMRSPVAFVPIALGLFFFIAGIVLLFLFRPSEKELTDYFKELAPPNLLFLAVARWTSYPEMHGEKVASLNPKWRHGKGEWTSKSDLMVKSGLLKRNNAGEVERSLLGTAVVYVALRERQFGEVADAVRSDSALAKEWGL